MNLDLRQEIVKHVYANLGIIASDYVNLEKSRSLRDKDFLLNEKLSFEGEDGEVINNRVWGCQISAADQEIKILLGDCSEWEDIPEFALIVQLKNAPAYGLYLVCTEVVNSEGLIACTLNSKDWMECNTYLQATFLAGMEQMKDIGLSWHKCTKYESQFKLLQSFIKFHSNIWEAGDEGQEG